MSIKTKLFTATALAAGITMTAVPAYATEDQPAVEVLDEIVIAEELSMDSYDRDEWAPNGWVDADDTGCDTQQDILLRDTDSESQVVDNADDCRLIYGTATDPFSGQFIEHDRDAEDFGRTPFDIDHIVPIGEAHRSGAADWDDQTRQEFYQDKENLLAVDAAQNRAKSDADVNNYLPPNQALYCDYVATHVYIKHKYDLTMDQAEYDVAASVLDDEECQATVAQPAVAMSGVEQTDMDAQADGSIEATDHDATMSQILDWTTDNPVKAFVFIAAVLMIAIVVLGLPKARR